MLHLYRVLYSFIRVNEIGTHSTVEIHWLLLLIIMILHFKSVWIVAACFKISFASASTVRQKAHSYMLRNLTPLSRAYFKSLPSFMPPLCVMEQRSLRLVSFFHALLAMCKRCPCIICFSLTLALFVNCRCLQHVLLYVILCLYMFILFWKVSYDKPYHKSCTHLVERNCIGCWGLQVLCELQLRTSKHLIEQCMYQRVWW